MTSCVCVPFDRVRVRVRDSTLGAKKRCLFKSVAFRFGFRVRVRVRDSTLGAKKRVYFKSECIEG